MQLLDLSISSSDGKILTNCYAVRETVGQMGTAEVPAESEWLLHILF